MIVKCFKMGIINTCYMLTNNSKTIVNKIGWQIFNHTTNVIDGVL